MVEARGVAVQNENVEQLMEWLAEGGDARSAHAGADQLVERLAALVFQGDAGWPKHTDRVDAYRQALSGWLAKDSARESQFADLARSDADPGMLIGWFLGVVQEWEQWAARSETGTATDGVTTLGLQSPNGDGTPGTEYYRYDEATGQYLYAATADGADWATYEARRYSEPAHDDNYGLDYRLDRTHQVYEWYDVAGGTWQDQTWADLHSAAGHDPAMATQTADGGALPEWDVNWAMFYRVGPGGVYEFADAVVPGDQSSGCVGQWLSHEQVRARRTVEPQPETGARAEVPENPAAGSPAPAVAAEVLQLQAEIRASVDSTFAEHPELREGLSEEDVEMIVKNLIGEAISS